MKNRYSIEDKTQLVDMVSSGAWNTVLKAASKEVEELKIQVLNARVDSGSREIVLRKARLEGAQKVLRYMQDIKQELKDV